MNRILGCVALGVILAPIAAHSTLTPIGIGGFSGTEAVITYGSVQTFAPINGVTFGGVLHNFTIGGVPSTDAVIDAGPGNTNNITVANIEGDTSGVLSLLFPTLETRLGFGFAFNASGDVAAATRVELFDAANVSLGALTFNGAPDPLFTGGFAGVESTIPYLSASVSWNSAAASRFAFDNLRFERVLPEPGTLALLAVMLVGLAAGRGRRE